MMPAGMVGMVMVAMLMVVVVVVVVMVAMPAEVDVRAAPMIGSWAVLHVVHVRHRRRSNHEMSDKENKR